MSNFLDLLSLDLSRIEEFIEPRSEVEEDEEVIGDMTDEQKRMYTKIQLLIREAMTHCGSEMIPRLTKLMSLDSREESSREEVLREADVAFSIGNELRTKMRFLTELLDILVKDEYSLWKPDWDVAYRRGFKIVKFRTIQFGD